MPQLYDAAIIAQACFHSGRFSICRGAFAAPSIRAARGTGQATPAYRHERKRRPAAARRHAAGGYQRFGVV